MQPYYPLILRALFSSSYSNFFAHFLINTHIFITVLFRKPSSSFSASIAKSPFNRNYPETPCSPPTENRPNIPRNSDRFHPRTFFRIILFSFHSERYVPISRQFQLISEQKKTQSTFPYLGSWLVLLVRRWGVLAGKDSTHFSLISELSSSIKVLISLNWR